MDEMQQEKVRVQGAFRKFTQVQTECKVKDESVAATLALAAEVAAVRNELGFLKTSLASLNSTLMAVSQKIK